MTENLAAWLLEQIAEDEWRAKAAGHGAYKQLGISQELSAGWAHLNWTAARVLAECAARRKVVEMCYAAWNGSYDLDADLAEKVLRALAQPYADRPGFDQSWRLDQHTG